MYSFEKLCQIDRHVSHHCPWNICNVNHNHNFRVKQGIENISSFYVVIYSKYFPKQYWFVRNSIKLWRYFWSIGQNHSARSRQIRTRISTHMFWVKFITARWVIVIVNWSRWVIVIVNWNHYKNKYDSFISIRKIIIDLC